MRTSALTEEQINKSIDRFGGCPECHDYDEQLNVYKIHWFVCHCHKTRWSVGCNLFDSWRHENESVCPWCVRPATLGCPGRLSRSYSDSSD